MMHKVVMITSMMQEITDIAEISPVLNPPMLDFGVIMNSETKNKKNNNNKKQNKKQQKQQMHLGFKLISRNFILNSKCQKVPSTG